MTEVLWPPDLVPSSQTWTTIGNAATFNSPFSGTSKTYGRPGVRMGCSITLPPVKGENRARMLAVVRALKDRGNAIWVPDFSTTLEAGLPVRGSFAATELFANNGFASGTTGWTGDRCTISVADRVLRAVNTKSGGANNFSVSQTSLSVTQYAPYVLRSMISALSRSGMSNGTNLDSTANYATDRAGLVVQSNVQLSATSSSVYPGVFDSAGTASQAGDYAELSWTSLARCILVDNGPNALTYSDQTDNGAWTGAGLASISANSASQTDPFGTTTAEKWNEDTSTGQHYRVQTGPAVSAAADYCGVVYARRDNLSRDVAVTVGTTGSGNFGQCIFDLGAGTAGTATAAGTATNARAFIVSLGNSWYACYLVVRLPTAATTASLQVDMASAGSISYTGTTGTLMVIRGGVAQSSVPFRPALVAATATTGTTQTSNKLYVKGLLASTQNLLKAGDMVQIGGQINQLIAPLDSNAAGLGVMICGNPWRSPADNAPVIVNTPMCKMQLATDTIDIETGPGQFSPFTLELVEVIE